VLAQHAPRWVPGTPARIIGRLERDIFPRLAGRPVGKVTAPELFACLRRIEAQSRPRTCLAELRRVFRYAMATGRAERDPAADLRGALAPVKETHYAAMTDPKAMGALLRAIDGYRGDLPTRYALTAGTAYVRSARDADEGYIAIAPDLPGWRRGGP